MDPLYSNCSSSKLEQLCNAQCAYDNVLYLTWTAPTVIGGTVSSSCTYGGEYNTVTGMAAGSTYRIYTCGNTAFNTQLTIYPAGGGVSVAYNDDFCGVQSEISFTPTISGDYDIMLDLFNCLNQSTCMDMIVELMSSTPITDDVGVISIDAPQSACGLSVNETVTVTVQNFGTNSQSNIPVSYTVDFGLPVNETITNTISPGGTLSYTFTAAADLSNLGNHNINVSTTLFSDGNNSNDATSITVDNINLSTITINMDIDRDSVCPGDEVIFAAYTQSPLDSYSWDYGDGATATTAWAPHSFSSTGNYNISLTLTCGNDTTTYYDSVFVGNNVYPDIADFTFWVSPDNTCPGDEVIFWAWPSQRASYLWDFDDGNTTTITNVFNDGFNNFDIARYTYSSIGNYSPILTITNGCGNSVTGTANPVVINNNAPVDGQFWWSNNSENPCVGEPVLFYGLGGTSYVWDFGDGTTNVTTNNSITPVNLTYTTAGSYNGSVMITNSCSNSQTYTWSITVDAVCVTGIEEELLSNDIMLKVYPNPILNEATIAFKLDMPSNVQLALYDLMGRRVELFIDKKESAGIHLQIINASDLNLTNG
ncbi:MAG: PKD domain-containing protein, partial [Bacteroidia bacterium]|nr:PKD domain-containing protein [Bacteroidia bacterium]